MVKNVFNFCTCEIFVNSIIFHSRNRKETKCSSTTEWANKIVKYTMKRLMNDSYPQKLNECTKGHKTRHQRIKCTESSKTGKTHPSCLGMQI